MATAKHAAPAKTEDPGSDPDRVPVVSRNSDGTPNQRPGFVLVVPVDPTDAELAAAWNLGGELPPKDQSVEYHPRTPV